ncbi:MAG: ABC transporter substrate-binding protein [Alphaproteobacteria bacterium]
MSASRSAWVAIAVGLVAVPAAAQQTITVSSWGGAYQDAQRKAWFEPAAKDLGITIKEDTTSGIADVRAQVKSGRVTWDLVQQGVNGCILAEREGILEKLDPAVVKTDGIPAEVKSDYWVANLVYSAVIAWNTKTYKDKKPEGWADFYDFKKFPGGRSMRRSPLYNLEAALVADGVDPKKLYPLDVDRAFKKMRELKPHIVAWWASGAQSAQLINDGEVDMIGLWNGRVQAVMKEGAKADLTFNQQLLLYDCWMIPKGAPNKAAAMKAMAHMLTPKAQAQLPLHINYGPANNDAFETGIIPPDIAKALPSAPVNMKSAILFDAKWWADNLDETTKRFDQFIQE